MSSFSSMVDALGRRLGVVGLKLDAQGCCRLVIDGRHMLEIRASSAQRRLVLKMLCGDPASSSSPGLERVLLQANLWGGGTAGGWFAIDEAGRICLQQEVALSDENEGLLLSKMEAMLNIVEIWEKRVAGAVGQWGSADAIAMARMTQRV